MAETHLDHPGEVKWYAGYGPRTPVGPCPHACPHDQLSTVAEGPDFDHYTLVECRAVCDGECRAWTVEYPPARRKPWWTCARPKFRLGVMVYVPARTSP